MPTPRIVLRPNVALDKFLKIWRPKDFELVSAEWNFKCIFMLAQAIALC